MYNTYTLKNGLRVVTEKIEHLNSISVGVMVQNGSRNETNDVNGISHFIEHMFFKGTNKRTSKEVMEDIENVGGQINAFTSKEATCYYIKALNTHLNLSLDVLSDILLNAKFDPDEIEKEKGVVIEEINMSQDSPEDVLDDLHSKVTFGKNPLGNPILGTIQLVKSFTREKILDYINEKYTPYNSVISICGNFDEQELKDLLEKYFGSWKSKKEYNPNYGNTIIQIDSGYTKKEREQLHISLGLQGMPYGDEDNYSLVLLNNVFGNGASSILFQKVREELGLCYSIYSYLQPLQEIGTLNIYAALNKNYVDKALEVIDRELAIFSKNGITDRQIEINKEKIKATYILGLESTSSRMFANAKSYLFSNKVKTQEHVIKKIDEIDRDSIQYVLDKCFKNGVLNAAYVGQEVEYNKLDSIILKNSKAYYSPNSNKHNL
ncbi:M16 family metallopeptidase [Clostridium saccharobutylicum]|uniref:Zinc protease YmxG n=1 Tax=Clostridium saccharobutylicum DSM 13864 TaxID=1345695 RepID=U5MPM5_CLOSA|nr:pitrilysin family protein [Clostridium saccharobutylicum]AGX42448.1 zinc protease YmxG [Clostridium saccharobutylicum DSM 13864]MBC2413722.1 insulinase family protein [Clostridium saccharobutylicum]MBC2481390.1 insulinase family protein [Clostridium saccharobutylicum]NSB98620.1 putative Zn-dependent peptidase [Clostridium saccharobutylicum]